jgi:DNA-binding GntR family transcriptional regulator
VGDPRGRSAAAREAGFSRATVYRALGALVEEGVLRTVSGETGRGWMIVNGELLNWEW